MYGLYSRAASNQERPMMARVRYVELDILTKFHRIKAKSTAVRDIARKSLVHIHHRGSDDMNMIRSEEPLWQYWW